MSKKTWRGVVVTTYQEELFVEAETAQEAELLMYDMANPMGDSYSGDMEVQNLKVVDPKDAQLKTWTDWVQLNAVKRM